LNIHTYIQTDRHTFAFIYKKKKKKKKKIALLFNGYVSFAGT
jgi:hypothetical protein